MAPLPTIELRDLLENESSSDSSLLNTLEPTSASLNAATSTLSPIEAHDLRLRTLEALKSTPTSSWHPGQGSQSPESFNNVGFQVLFALIGAAMVLASIWFFFWAKNGGFIFRQGDWEDYKSTVLRRKGPDGRTLSNATKSTKLGGSTIAGTQRYKWAKQAARSVVGRDEKGRKGVMGKRGWAGTHSITYSDDYLTETIATQTVTDEMTEVSPALGDDAAHSGRYRDRDIQDYRRERPARVGGLNRVADASHQGTSYTDGSEVYTEASEQPMLKKTPKDKERERAERKAREDAAKMERRWKKEAEEAAAALARETNLPSMPKKAAIPKSSPSPKKAREEAARRTSGYHVAPTEISSTVYTGTSGQRTASYYDEYRPRESPRYVSASEAHDGRTRQASPKKKPQGGRAGGYRRGADSELD